MISGGATKKTAGIAAKVAEWARGFKTTAGPVGAPFPIPDGDRRQLTAKEQGEWYLHTVLGR